MNTAILIDFGSTFTKAAVVCLQSGELIFTTKTTSTVMRDARIGLEICLESIKNHIGDNDFIKAKCLASSSAAGGLRMVVVGLTPSLSIMAGKNAAFGAGAKIIGTFSHRLNDQDIEKIIRINPEIILLCGGYEGGNANWSIDNANKIAQCSYIHSPIIYAGNNSISQEVRFIFTKEKKECKIVENIIPDTGILQVEPAVEAIRDIFMKRIVNMKGLDKVKEYVGDIAMPTPAAVLTAGKLLAQGTDKEPGFGEVMIIDVGGATTDVHSFSPEKKPVGIRLMGSPEPFAKRTVEGDLGARESSNSLIEAVGLSRAASKLGMTESELECAVKRRVQDIGMLADSDKEREFELFLAMEAVRIATRRHAGKHFCGYGGEAHMVQQGKDLRNIEYIIGTGGPIINSLSPETVLKNALCDPQIEPDVLLPYKAHFLLDKEYILYAAGLLNGIDKDIAFKVLKNNSKAIF